MHSARQSLFDCKQFISFIHAAYVKHGGVRSNPEADRYRLVPTKGDVLLAYMNAYVSVGNRRRA
jgi:hypothetical protein